MKAPSQAAVSLPLLGVLLLLSATVAASKLTEHRKHDILALPLTSIDRHIAGFTASDNPPLSESVLAQLKSDSYLTRAYHKPGAQLDLFIVFYAQQRAGESMHSPKHCLPGGGWEIVDYSTVTIPVQEHSYTVNRYSISHEGERRLVLYWYQSKRRIVASEYLGKILLVRDAFLQNSTAASIVRIIAPDQPHAYDDARQFASELIPQVQRCFGF